MKPWAERQINEEKGRMKVVRTSMDDGTMNGLERDFFQMQRQRLAAGEIAGVKHEPFKLRLANSTFYTPDFAIFELDMTVTLVEVKGFWRDDARVKIKVAAREHPYFRFVAAQRDHGCWLYEEF